MLVKRVMIIFQRKLSFGFSAENFVKRKPAFLPRSALLTNIPSLLWFLNQLQNFSTEKLPYSRLCLPVGRQATGKEVYLLKRRKSAFFVARLMYPILYAISS